MIARSFAHKHYASATQRLLEATIAKFFEDEFPRLFGPTIRAKLAVALTALVEAQTPPKEHLRPGQCLWNAVSVSTRPDSAALRLVPVVLTLVDAEDISWYVQGVRQSTILKRAIRRLLQEAYAQGALLSMRDLALLFSKNWRQIALLRRQAETESGEILPHVGSIQDFGSTVSHKESIIRKVVYEGKDPRDVSRETHHSQRAVDRYLKDFYRVRTCLQEKPDIDFIRGATGMSKYLIRVYLGLIEKYEKNT